VILRVGQAAIAVCVATWVLATVAFADRAERFSQLMTAIRLDDTVVIMREEGLEYGSNLITDMMADADTPGWQIRVGQIYDTGRMRALLETRLLEELGDTDLEPMLEFFASDLGAEIIGLELAARRAFFDEDVEMAARDKFEDLTGNDDRIVEQINEMMADSDLVEFNVMGILNANLMLYRGLADGGALDLGEEDILADVWMSEESVREESRSWIQAYFLTAYRPLNSNDLERYAEFWRTEAGEEFNRALFAVFDQMYEELSYLLGRAAAEHMQGEEL
jgi:hypothetical protein